MTLDQGLQTLFYLLLVLFAFGRTWPHKGRRQVGIVLLATWVASNVIFWMLVPGVRPQLFSFLEVLFALTAAKAGKETDSRTPMGLVALSVLAICANTAFSFSAEHTLAQINTYEIVLNAIFAAQCLCCGFWGPIDEFLRTGRIPVRPRAGRGAAQLAGRTDKG